jgi:tetratricopeptide (TPR) repeat protein
VTIGVLTLTIVLVGSGKFYAWTGEGRTVGWGDRPLWFARDAARFAGSKGMPDRFIVYHNGHAGIFEYFNGPDQKVYADARLEVMGPELFGSYNTLGEALDSEKPHWEERIAALASRTMPGALIDNLQAESARQGATFLGSTDWRCVWYDPVASVFLHRSSRHPARTVDFAGRHFGLDPETEPRGIEALIASARGLMFHAVNLAEKHHKPKMIEAMMTLGVGHAGRAIALNPGSADAWKWLGEIETLRVPGPAPDSNPRFRMPFDPIVDLPMVRATYDLRRAETSLPDDFPVLQLLFNLYHLRGMNEAARPLGDHLIEVADTPNRKAVLERLKPDIARVKAATQSVPPTSWKNRGELERVIASLLTDGRAEMAADLIEKSYSPAERTWDQTDRLATIRLHLGRPDLARAAWLSAGKPPRPALGDARVAMTYLVENDFKSARELFRKALVDEPRLYEAHYGLAVLERDAGRAPEALASAKAALSSAGSEAAKAAAEEIIRFVEPYGAEDRSIRR